MFYLLTGDMLHLFCYSEVLGLTLTSITSIYGVSLGKMGRAPFLSLVEPRKQVNKLAVAMMLMECYWKCCKATDGDQSMTG